MADDVYPDSTFDNTIGAKEELGEKCQNTMAGSNVKNKERKKSKKEVKRERYKNTIAPLMSAVLLYTFMMEMMM